MLSVAPLFLAALFYTPPMPFVPLTEADVIEAPTRHIRTTDPKLRDLLRRGFRQSSTFAGLMKRLQRTDVIVYVEDVPRLPGALEGRLMMLPRASGFRYVRIQLSLRGLPDDAIATLGHELQHAVEVADALDVTDTVALEKLYQRIGMRSGPRIYDTIAAQDAGRTVRRELGLAPTS